MSLPRVVPERIEDRLIVALDVPSIGEARDLDGLVSFFKVGLWLQFAAGFDSLIEELIKRGKKIFPVLCSKRHHNKIAAGEGSIIPYGGWVTLS
jgi:orotidine-5'-phosphate decarboxylase